MRKIPGLCAVILAGWTSLGAVDYNALKEEAEKFYAEGSYGRALEVYQKAKDEALPEAESRWVAFRLADTLWRSAAATENRDQSKLDQARHELEVLVRDRERRDQQDQVWAEVKESLGDFFWMRRESRDWSSGWNNYGSALEWWARSPRIELARERYLGIIRKASRPPEVDRHYYYGYYGNYLPLEILENGLKIATTAEDQAHLHFLLAMTMRFQHGGEESRTRIPMEFEAAVQSGKKTDWFDDALYNYAEHLITQGEVIPLKEGGVQQKQNYVKALGLFQRLLDEFREGETAFYSRARDQVRAITKPALSLHLSGIFLPGSEITFSANWRNMDRIEFALYKVELVRDLKFSGDQTTGGQWLSQVDLTGKTKLKSWSKETGDKGEYQPGHLAERLEKLEPGAYLVEGSGGGEKAREIILVTDAAIVIKSSGKQGLVYVCDVNSGAPLGNSAVRLWERIHIGNGRWRWREEQKSTDAQGLCLFDLSNKAEGSEIFVVADASGKQAFSPGSAQWWNPPTDAWKIYAYTDRPAYRPNEKVQWKLTARISDRERYSTPAGKRIQMRVSNPQGAEVKKQTIALNEFGSAWGELDLTEAMPLGEYRVEFMEEKGETHIGGDVFFRLEEYKLPEFRVTVKTPEEDGRKKVFLLGDKIEAEIDAQYYFGGAVANATVEVVVHQSPLYHVWYPERKFSWYYERESQPHRWNRGEQVIQRETLTTDAQGKAKLVINTAGKGNQDLEFRIEARVTDASRREILGSDTVRVSRQPYFVHAKPAHHLYKPQDKVEVEFKTIDPNNHPVAAEGLVKVTRDYWFEVWLDPNGREVKGEELKQLQSGDLIFPPPPRNRVERPWRLKFRGYEHDDILARTVKTGTNGVGTISFTPEREGYYRIAWTSQDLPTDRKFPLLAPKTETTVWVATSTSAELGYRSGGLEIIVDKDTFQSGQKAPVMLSVPTNDHYVLFTSESHGLLNYQLVHVTGSVKLLELEIGEQHVPNFFLSGVMVSDRQIFMDTKEIVVPPAQNFLEVSVKPSQEQYQPREEGTFEVTVKDHQGKPVEGEIAFSAVDESVFYIQKEYRGDPRQFFFGDKRPHYVRTDSTFNQRHYFKYIQEEEGLVDEKQKYERRRSEADRYYFSQDSESSMYDKRLAELPQSRAAGGALASRGLLAMKAMSPSPSQESRVALGANVELLDLAALQVEPQAAENQAESAVQVRSDFRTTAFWQPDVRTGSDGKATVKLKYPDSVTGWKSLARVVTKENRFGVAETITRTKQPLIVRIQASRFFLAGDVVTVSANINNNTDEELTVNAQVEFEGLLTPLKQKQEGIKVPAQGETRLDWPVKVATADKARIKVTVRGSKHADAVERTYPLYEHGIDKFLAQTGKMKDSERVITLTLPAERKADSTKLTVQVTPSLAVTMLDALPYLIDYPYGCTEQTMSRFLPAAITAKTLKDLGLDPAEVMQRVFGGIEQGHTNKTQPKGKKNLAELDAMIKQGLERLYSMQHDDGGWGWWKETPSDNFMSAYVVWGLALAHKAGLEVQEQVLESGVNYLVKHLVEAERAPDLQSWMLHALSEMHQARKRPALHEFETKAFENSWKQRDQLNAYSRALLALTAHNYNLAEKAAVLVRNLENGVKRDTAGSRLLPGSSGKEDAGGTARWGSDGISWRWSEGGVEATAFALRALMTIEPKHPLIEPSVNWLIKNRRGAQWSNTRDTAITLLALNDYLRISGEAKADVEFAVEVNGQAVATRKISGADVFSAPSNFEIDRALLKDGENQIRVKRTSGENPLYYAAYAEFFTREEPIIAAGHEIFASRQYYRIKAVPTLLKGYVYEKELLKDGETLNSGDRVEVLVTIEAKNNYEYLVFEDLKPAGLEAVEVRSGEPLYVYQLREDAIERKHKDAEKRSGAEARRSLIPPPRPLPPGNEDHTGDSRSVHQELRDRKVACFIDKLGQGTWELRYELRAEVPGEYHALPLLGHAMYVPEIRCNSAETHVRIQDKQQ